MKRLPAVIAVLLLLMVCVAGAQSMGKLPRVGILITANPRLYDTFVEELRRLGYVDGQNIVLEFRSAEGRIERFPVLAADLVRAGVDVTLAVSEASVRAAQQATTSTPIVIVAIDYDPLALKMVTSLARPGGNVTGVFLQQLEVTAKRIELLKAMLPKLTRLAVLWDPSGADQFKAADAAAASLGLRVQSLKIRPNPDDLSGAFAAAVRERADAIAVVQTAVLFRERAQIVQMATSHRLPAAFAFREFAETGGLMSYGAHLPDMFRRAAFYVDRILKGARAGDLPMEQPTKFELVINLKTAKALGLTIPQTLLLRADQVIQ
jgi:putative tryptophan/tyrosine transport system substrate-binding protein